MAIPDWVARETLHLPLACFHTLAGMFWAGEFRRNEDGSEVMVLREEWPIEQGLLTRRDALRGTWRTLQNRIPSLTYLEGDHITVTGRKGGSYVVSLQDPIAKFLHVPNRNDPNSSKYPASAALPGDDFESEQRALTRARANIIPCDAGAATHHPTTATTPTPTTSTSSTSTQQEQQPPLPSLEEALELVGFTEDKQASELLTSFGFNNVAVALRYLVRGLKRSARGQQPPISSRTGYVIQFLGANSRKQFEEVTDFSFLGYLRGWVGGSSAKVIEFPGRAD